MTGLSVYSDILVLGLTVAAIGVLGFIIFFSNPKSATHKAFLIFSCFGIVWGVINFIAYQVTSEDMSLTLWRFVIFTATWFCFSIFQLAYVFPSEEWRSEELWYRIALFVATFISILTLTPYVFARIADYTPGQIPVIENGPLIPLFGLSVAAFVISSIWQFVKKGFLTDRQLMKPVIFIMSGTGATFALLIVFNFVLPTMFRIFSFIPFGAVFILPFVLCTAVAIGRYQLFNIRLVAAELFSFLLVIATLVQILFSSSLVEILFRVAVFVLVLALSILFVRAVVRDIQQRETIEKQEKELEVANAKQEILLHFISHEIKGYLTKGQNAFAGILEGDYGEAPPKIKELSDGALHEMRKGVSTVMEILDASNLKKGTMTFEKEPLDLKPMVKKVVDDAWWGALRKGLQLEIVAPEDAYVVAGDKNKLTQHVLRNLIDNSVRYTQAGKVTVTLTKENNSVYFTVSDTGVGITPEDMQHLFTEGGHGKDSRKINVDSTGYGLFVAKQVVAAHGGKISAFSEGEGKGSRFTVELPAAQ